MSSHPGLDKEMLLTGEEAHAWVEVYIDGIGWVPVEVTGGYGGHGGGGGGGEQKTPSLVVSAYSAEKYYDGRPFDTYEGDYAWISQGALLPGHRLVAKVQVKDPDMILPGSSPTMFSQFEILDSSGKSVSYMYQIQRKTGKQTILRRPITIATASVSKVYDGTPLSTSEYWIVSGSLAEGEEMTVQITGEITSVGTITPKVMVTIKVSETNKVVNSNYDVTVIPGTLKVYSP